MCMRKQRDYTIQLTQVSQQSIRTLGDLFD